MSSGMGMCLHPKGLWWSRCQELACTKYLPFTEILLQFFALRKSNLERLATSPLTHPQPSNPESSLPIQNNTQTNGYALPDHHLQNQQW
jgi:hypothetical protein